MRYGDADGKPEQYQRLGFKGPSTFLEAVEEAERLRSLLKRMGDYKKLALICVARENTMKNYGRMPSSVSYFGYATQPQFIKDALKASKERQSKNKTNSKLKKVKPVSYTDLTPFTARGVEKPKPPKEKKKITVDKRMLKNLRLLLNRKYQRR